MRWRTLGFVLTGLAGAVLFAGSLTPLPADGVSANGDHAGHAGHTRPDAAGHRHGGGSAAAFTRPAGVAVTFVGATGVFWLVSRRRTGGAAGG